MAIKVDVAALTAQIGTLEATAANASVGAIDISISKTTVASIRQFQDVGQQLKEGLTSVQTFVRKLSSNAKSAQSAVVEMDMQINQEISNALNTTRSSGGE